jgi:hypothetical protein
VRQPVVVTLVLVLLAVGVGVGVRRSLSSPAPRRITVQGVELRRTGEVPFIHARLADDDPSVLVVEAGENYPGPPRTCRTWVTAQLLHEDASTVRVATFLYRTVKRPPDACTLEGYLPKPLRVQLAAPLAGRELYDGDAPVPTPVLDPSALLVLPSPPPGYARTGKLTVDDGNPHGGSTFAVRTYAGPKQSAIEVYQGRPQHGPGPVGDALSDIEVVRSRPAVRGHAGVVHQARSFDDVICLRWNERIDLVVSVCTRGNPAPLNGDQLVKLAETLALPRS